jgi:uncharacterized membrane protein
MLSYIDAGDGVKEAVLQWVEYAAILIEVLAVVIICIAVVIALSRYLWRYATHRTQGDPYHELKVSLGKALLLGLETLVAADVIYTVALKATLQSVLVLGLLVLIRTFLSWALVVELEGRWPWQKVDIVQKKG